MGGWSCGRSDFARFCIIIHELVYFWDGHATCQTKISKHRHCNLTRNVLWSIFLPLCLEREQHTTDKKTTFSAEMLSLSKNALFSVLHARKGNQSKKNDLDTCTAFCIIWLYILPYISIHIYIYIHIAVYVRTIWQIYCVFFFTTVDGSGRRCIFDIEKTWV